jgi:hypothetical protein
MIHKTLGFNNVEISVRQVLHRELMDDFCSVLDKLSLCFTLLGSSHCLQIICLSPYFGRTGSSYNLCLRSEDLGRADEFNLMQEQIQVLTQGIS